MDNENDNGPVDTDPQPVTDVAAQPEQTRQDEPLRNYREVIDLKKDVRDIQRMLRDSVMPALTQRQQQQPQQARPESKVPERADAQQPQPPPYESLAADMAALRREMKLKDAFLELNIVDPDARELIAAAVETMDPSDVREFVARYAPKFAPKAEPVVAKTPTLMPQGQPVSDSGAPNRSPAPPPLNLTSIDPAAFKALPIEERKKYFQRYNASTGGDRNINPFERAVSAVRK